jgi:hypothetical protein
MRQFDIATATANEIGLAHPDDSHAIHKAASPYNHALHEYSTALKRFSSFILGERRSE